MSTDQEPRLEIESISERDAPVVAAKLANDTEGVAEAEELLTRFVHGKMNTSHRYLEEHATNGLPSLDESVGRLARGGPPQDAPPDGCLGRPVNGRPAVDHPVDADVGDRAVELGRPPAAPGDAQARAAPQAV